MPVGLTAPESPAAVDRAVRAAPVLPVRHLMPHVQRPAPCRQHPELLRQQRLAARPQHQVPRHKLVSQRRQ